MVVSISDIAPSVYRSTSLRERIVREQSLLTQQRTSSDHLSEALDVVRRWYGRLSFMSDDMIEQRIASLGTSADVLCSVILNQMKALEDTNEVVGKLLSVLAMSHLSVSDTEHQSESCYRLSGDEPNVSLGGFLSIAQPFVMPAVSTVQKHVQTTAFTQANLIFDESDIVRLLLPELAMHINQIVSRTLALEVNVARLRGELSGGDEHERFGSFVTRLSDPDFALKILLEYPVMTRAIMHATECWQENSITLIDRLVRDLPDIGRVLHAPVKLGALSKIQTGVGDGHRGHQSVKILHFSSGYALVYKPRSLALEHHFGELIEWMNALGAVDRLRAARVVDRHDYGWMEYIDAAPCTSMEDVRAFYRKQGALLGLMYILDATDFHFENLIASHSDPVLVDLESLFQPRFVQDEHDLAIAHAARALSNSVLRSGLLPQATSTGPDSESFDVSGLTGSGGQLTPYELVQWESQGTDSIHVVRRRALIEHKSNRPVLDATPVEVQQYLPEIVEGFERAYRAIVEHRDDLLTSSGVLASFSHDEVRAILRPTRTYAMLLQESFHPDLLRDGLVRSRHFDHLWAAVPFRPHLRSVIEDEVRDLEMGDIPVFVTTPSEHHIWSSSGRLIPDMLPETSMDYARHRIAGMDESDLARQVWIIRASFATRMAAVGHANMPHQPSSSDLSTWDVRRETRPITKARILGLARRAATYLATAAYRGTDDATWIGLTSTGNSGMAVAPIGPDLYAGLTGVALFLGHLGRITGEYQHTELAQQSLQQLLKVLSRKPLQIAGIGGHTGAGGIVYALAELDRLWNDPALRNGMESILDILPEIIQQDGAYDIIGGAAGCLASLLAVYRRTGWERALELAVACAEHLVKSAIPSEPGIAWPPPHGIAEMPLTGFAHGTAGIAWALHELNCVVPNAQWEYAIRGALQYERSAFVPEAGNWKDFRKLAQQRSTTGMSSYGYATTWCHGAPGIGLARARMARRRQDTVLTDEVRSAITATLAGGFGANHSLCHGDLGCIELLTEAELVVGDHSLRRHRSQQIRAVIEGMERYGMLTGVPSSIETPGLMTGIAGIGYGLLRLADPAGTPSVLLFD